VLYLPAAWRHGWNIVRDGFSPNFVMPFQLFSSLWAMERAAAISSISSSPDWIIPWA